MITEFVLTILSFLLDVFFSIIQGIFAVFDVFVLPGDWGASIGTVFGNIWLLNSFLPVDHLFIALSIAITWKIALFAYDGTMYLITLAKTLKSLFFGMG